VPPFRAGRMARIRWADERLADEGIVVRSLPEPSAVRASIHAVNTESEVDRLATALTAEF